MNLIIILPDDSTGNHRYRLTDHRAEHIRTVLKLEAGDSVEVGLLNGPQGRALIESIDERGVDLVCETLETTAEVFPAITLICALPRPQTMKKVLITVATMGVRAVHFIRANRVEKSYFQSPMVEPEQQLPFLLEGLSQGKVTRLPKVEVHDRFRRFVEDELGRSEPAPSLRLVSSPEYTDSLVDVCPPATKAITLAIGPEGGWVPFELDLLREVGFAPYSLGRWVLRVESAVTAALAQLELLQMTSSPDA